MSLIPERFTLSPYRLYMRYFSKTPWLDFTTNGLATDGQVKLELDWNEEFIIQMHGLGLGAENDEETVRNYLTSLTMHMRNDENTHNTEAHPNMSKDHSIRR